MNTLADTGLALREDGTIDLNGTARGLLESVVNAVMEEQASELCRESGTCRNGYRERSLSTCVGPITLRIPKLREGTYFPEDIVERWSRTDTALASAICEMWVNGVSTRAVDRVASEMGVERMSRSRISRLCAALDAEVAEMRSCDLSGTDWPYLWLDATYVSCREAGAARSTALVMAVAASSRARRRVVAVECMDTESYVAWRDLLLGLRERGLGGVQLVVSDEHAGLVRAVREVMIGAAHQRCTAHLERNVMDRARRKGDGAAAVAALKAAFAESDPALVRAGYDRACEMLRAHDPDGAGLLEAAREEALAYLWFPSQHKNWIRTNNVCERLFGEVKRRTRAVQVFPSRESLVRLVGALACEVNDAWSCERNFIDGRSMRDLAPAEPAGRADAAEIERVVKMVELAFERRRSAA